MFKVSHFESNSISLKITYFNSKKSLILNIFYKVKK